MARARMEAFGRRVPVEALFWIAALIGVASIDPQSAGLNLCLLEHLGLPCPGDGLGRAIALLVRGEFAASWALHPLAGPAVALIGAHVVRLCRSSTAPDAPPLNPSHVSTTAAPPYV